MRVGCEDQTPNLLSQELMWLAPFSLQDTGVPQLSLSTCISLPLYLYFLLLTIHLFVYPPLILSALNFNCYLSSLALLPTTALLYLHRTGSLSLLIVLSIYFPLPTPFDGR